MKRTQKLLIMTVISMGMLFAHGSISPAAVSAGSASTQQACSALGGTWSGGECVTEGPTLEGTISNVVNIFSIIIGIIAVFMVIYGGLTYITARGDSGKLNAARDTIIYALVGLVIAGLAQALVRFVLTEAA